MAQTPQRSLITQYSDGQVVISKIRKKRNTIPIFGANEEYSATLVTSWYDGSPMDDTKADGSVYFKLKALPQGADPAIYGQYVGSYFRVNLPKFGETFLEKDTMQSMRDLSLVEVLLLKMGYYKGVKLNGYYDKNDTPSPIEYYLSETADLDDGGSVIVVSDVKLEHDFKDVIDVRYLGYFSGYEGVSFLSKAFNIARNVLLEHYGDYTFSNNTSVSKPEVHLDGRNSIIRASNDYDTTAPTSGIFLGFSGVTVKGAVSDLRIDLNQKASEGLKFLNTQSQISSTVISDIHIVGVEVYNGYKSSSIGSGSNNATGVYVRGSFRDVLIEKCYIHNFLSENITSANTRGVLLSQNNDEVTWIKKASILDCRIEEIAKPIGGAVYDSDGIFMSNFYNSPYQISDTLRSSLVVKNCEFSNCYGRAVKSQVGTTLIEGCTSYSDKYNQQAVFDFQRNQGVAKNNTIILNNVSSRIFECAMFDPFPQSFIIEGNTVEIIGNNTERDIIFINVGGQGGGAPYNTSFKNVKVTNNIVKGKIAYFINARVQSEAYFNEMDCINNTVNGVTAFIRTWTYGTSTNYGLLSVNCQDNTNNDTLNNTVWLEAQNSMLRFSNYSGNTGFSESFKPNELKVASSTYAGTDYNVKCDGLNDDVEIRTSINRFRGHKGTIRLTDGTFNIQNSGTVLIETPDKISLIGAGSTLTVIDFKTSSSYGLSFLGMSTGDTLKGISFKCDSANKTTAGVRGVFTNCLVEDIEVYGSSSVGLYQSSQGYNAKFKNIVTRNNTSHGLQVMPNESSFEDVRSFNNQGNGVLSNSATNSSNVTFNNIVAYSNNNGINITGTAGFTHKNYKVSNLNLYANTTNDFVISNRISDSFVVDSVFTTVNNTSATVRFFNKALSSPDTATQASGETPTKAEFDALLAELRDLKNKLRAPYTGLLTP